MIVQCATFSKNLNPRNIDKNVSDIRNRIRLPYESSFWISVSGCKLTILPDIQPANRIVIISAGGLHSKLGCGKGRVGGLPFSATRPTHLRSQPDRLFVQPAGPPFCLLLEVFGRWFSWVRSNPVLQILNPNPIRIRHQLNSSNPTPVWVQEIYVNQTNSNVFLSTHKIQIQTLIRLQERKPHSWSCWKQPVTGYKKSKIQSMCFSWLHRLELLRQAQAKDVNSGH